MEEAGAIPVLVPFLGQEGRQVLPAVPVQQLPGPYWFRGQCVVGLLVPCIPSVNCGLCILARQRRAFR